jgi:hypothetical protein
LIIDIFAITITGWLRHTLAELAGHYATPLAR